MPIGQACTIGESRLIKQWMHVGRATEKVWENEQLHVDTMKQRIATQTYPPVAMDSLSLGNIKLSIQNRSGFAQLGWLSGGESCSNCPTLRGSKHGSLPWVVCTCCRCSPGSIGLPLLTPNGKKEGND